MTEKQLRENVCAQARMWLGRNEKDGTHKPIIDLYNTINPLPRGYKLQYTDAWCAGFVSAIAQACGLTQIIFPECSCGRMISEYQRNNRWMETDSFIPQPGDVLFYDWQDSGAGDCTGEPDHVGLVVEVKGRSLSIIEGNASDAVKLITRTVDSRYIRGYGLPDYASMASGEEEARPDPEPYALTCKPVIPYLIAGDTCAAVAALQGALTYLGYPCGKIDGDYGPKTESAVQAFKKDKGLNPSYLDIGKKTWTKLLS